MFTLSNALSLSRAPLTLLFLWDDAGIRLASILMAMITDSIDGYIARRFKTTSRLGTILDPLMDKVFVVCALLTLSLEGKILLWQAAAMMARDLMLCCFGIYLGFRGLWSAYTFRAIIAGKVSTALQFIILSGIVLRIPLSNLLFYAFIPLALLGFYELAPKRRSEGLNKPQPLGSHVQDAKGLPD